MFKLDVESNLNVCTNIPKHKHISLSTLVLCPTFIIQTEYLTKLAIIGCVCVSHFIGRKAATATLF